MQAIRDSNLAQGAWGVAAGLDYKPAYFAQADELVKVTSVGGSGAPISRTTTASGLGSVSSGSSIFDLSLAVAQTADDHFARGRVQVLDRSSGTVWVTDRLGVIQAAPGWASITATLRDVRGNLRAASVTADYAGEAAATGKPALVLSFEGQRELTGPPLSRVKIAAR